MSPSPTCFLCNEGWDKEALHGTTLTNGEEVLVHAKCMQEAARIGATSNRSLRSLPLTLEAFAAEMQARAFKAGDGSPVFWKYEKWSVAYSDLAGDRHLSIRLIHGCSSTVEDWALLGRIVAIFGAPSLPVNGFPEDPLAIMHWDWKVS